MIDKAINRVLAQPLITWSVAINRAGAAKQVALAIELLA